MVVASDCISRMDRWNKLKSEKLKAKLLQWFLDGCQSDTIIFVRLISYPYNFLFWLFSFLQTGVTSENLSYPGKSVVSILSLKYEANNGEICHDLALIFCQEDHPVDQSF